ncbi:MAG: patatin-like phospholipase family protein [Prevotellaceae bacterium]|jgi:NTE family protein|nr:patatin-like phospholipase family protein [Prevotellaceae bacterium]
MKKILLSAIISAFVANMHAQFNNQPEHKIGIVLSGGGALGFAHIGALQALEEQGIRPTIVAGASMGALVGVFYANGYTPSQIYEIVKHEKFDNVLNIVVPIIKHQKLGLSSQKNILKMLKKYINHNSFGSLRYPLYVSITNLTTGKVEYVSSGENLSSVVLASAAIPVVFEAVKIDGNIYVDGGVLNNLPAQPVNEKCKYLIGINVKPDYEFKKANSFWGILLRSMQLIISENAKEGENMCDILIKPKSNRKYDEFSFKAFEEIYQDGYNEMKNYLDANPQMVEKLTKQ